MSVAEFHTTIRLTRTGRSVSIVVECRNDYDAMMLLDLLSAQAKQGEIGMEIDESVKVLTGEAD